MGVEGEILSGRLGGPLSPAIRSAGDKTRVRTIAALREGA